MRVYVTSIINKNKYIDEILFQRARKIETMK